MSLRHHFLAFAAGLLVAFGAGAANLYESPVLLVAKPEVADFYTKTVLLARPIGEGRHIGFIVNRPTTVATTQLLPEHARSQELTEPVFLGGPLHVDAVFALVHQSESPGGRTLALAKDVFLALDVATVDHVVEENPRDTRFYAGLVVWQPGELESELRRGIWYVMDHDAGLVFRKSTDGLWEELVSRSRHTL